MDEAAGIPVFEASTLLRRAKRVIMATTLDGNLDTLKKVSFRKGFQTWGFPLLVLVISSTLR